jgi:hypothetical protein
MPRRTTGRLSRPTRLPVLHQAPELGDGHLVRASLSLFRKELVILADRDLLWLELVIGLEIVNLGYLKYSSCRSIFSSKFINEKKSFVSLFLHF